MTLYERHIRSELETALEDTPVVVINGPRQSGKSTLAQQIAAVRGARYVTLDEEGPRQAANADPAEFVTRGDDSLFVDEFQKAPALLDAIKARVDQARYGGRRPAGMYLLTGFANVWGTLRISESLAGRAERVELWPLSQGEIAGQRETFVDDLFARRVSDISGAPTARRIPRDARSSGTEAPLALGGGLPADDP